MEGVHHGHHGQHGQEGRHGHDVPLGVGGGLLGSQLKLGDRSFSRAGVLETPLGVEKYTLTVHAHMRQIA